MNKYKYIYKTLYTETNFSKIYKYKDKIIKRIPKNNNYDYKNEYNMLKLINDSNIIKILETYEDNKYFYTVMKYYELGDLHYNISNNTLNTKNYKSVVNKLINPINIIHKKNIVHMDLKLENYLLNNNQNYLLFDFSLSKQHNKYYYDLIKTNYKIGTKYYISPEALDGYYCKSSDMYSLGCMLHVIYTNKYFDNIDLSKELLKKTNNNLKNLIFDLLNDNYKLRPTVYDIKYSIL